MPESARVGTVVHDDNEVVAEDPSACDPEVAIDTVMVVVDTPNVDVLDVVADVVDSEADGSSRSR